MGRDVAAALGATRRGEGFISGESDIVTWCVGHLVELDDPQAYDPRFERWRVEDLPILPAEFKYHPSERTLEQFNVIRALLGRGDVTTIVNAADAGREGELIFDLVYDTGGLPQAGRASVDFVAHARRHPRGLPEPEAGRASTGACATRRTRGSAPTGSSASTRRARRRCAPAAPATRASSRSAASRRRRSPSSSSATKRSQSSSPPTTSRSSRTFARPAASTADAGSAKTGAASTRRKTPRPSPARFRGSTARSSRSRRRPRARSRRCCTT